MTDINVSIGDPMIGITKDDAGCIVSDNWSTTEGTKIDLNNGEIFIGGSDSPRFVYDASGLVVRGEIRVENLLDDVGSLLQHGYFATGDASYVTSTNTVTGSGILYGSIGIVGINDGVITFYLDPTTGEMHLNGESVVVNDGSGGFTSGNNNSTGYIDAQKTADIALKNTLDVNHIIEMLNQGLDVTTDGGTNWNNVEFRVTP